QDIFLKEEAGYGNGNVFFDLLSIPHMVLNASPGLKIINDLLKAGDPDSPMAALSCDVIQKTFFTRRGLDGLHRHFPNAVEALSTVVIEPLQRITTIAFFKEYVRTFWDANQAIIDDPTQPIAAIC